jgi:hypothetical protein
MLNDRWTQNWGTKNLEMGKSGKGSLGIEKLAVEDTPALSKIRQIEKGRRAQKTEELKGRECKRAENKKPRRLKERMLVRRISFRNGWGLRETELEKTTLKRDGVERRTMPEETTEKETARKGFDWEDGCYWKGDDGQRGRLRKCRTLGKS